MPPGWPGLWSAGLGAKPLLFPRGGQALAGSPSLWSYDLGLAIVHHAGIIKLLGTMTGAQGLMGTVSVLRHMWGLHGH